MTLINPGRPISEKITQLTGITDEMVRTAPLMENVIGELLAFCGGLPLLGHNILFDYRFLKQAAVNSQLECEFEAVDTLTLCRHLMPPDEKKIYPLPVPGFRFPSLLLIGQRRMQNQPTCFMKSLRPFMGRNGRSFLFHVR